MAAFLMIVPWVVVLVLVEAVSGQQSTIQPTNLTLCEPVTNENVTRFMSDVYVVQPQQYESCSLSNISTPVLFRVSTSAMNVNLSAPVVFTVRSERYVQTWRIPLELPQVSQLFYTVDRILCSVPPTPLSEWMEGEVLINVLTSSTRQENYDIEVTPVEDAVIRLDTEVQLQISANSPAVRYFEFPPSISSVMIKATNSDFNINDGCIIVSAKKAACPVDVIHQSALSNGVYQTMLTKAAVPVTRRIGRAFFLVLSITNSTFCDSSYNSQDSLGRYNNAHTINVTISVLNQTGSLFVLGIVLPPILFVIFGGLAILFFGCLYDWDKFPKYIRDGCNPFVFCMRKKSSKDHEHVTLEQDSDQKPHEIRDIESDYELQQTDDNDNLTPLERGDRRVKVSHMLKNPTGENLNKHYRVYGWTALIAGIFYGLPAIQFVIGQQLDFNRDGNQDVCYYNFECIHPLGVVTSFNGIWSNTGYVILGFVFIIIVMIRHYKSYRKEGNDRWSKGVPHFYGLFYGMGVALIMEGIMSAMYHVCPSELNFQFDTAFMFIIGGLLTIKVLQARHPDINCYAYIAYVSFAVVILLTLIGIHTSYEGAEWVTYVLGLIMMFGIVIFFALFYHHHQVKKICQHIQGEIVWFKHKSYCAAAKTSQESIDCCAHTRGWMKHHIVCCHCLKNPVRLIRLILITVIVLVVGIALMATGASVPNIVLYLFIVTMFTILTFYIVLKWCIHMEPCSLAAYITLLFVPCMIAAVYVFGIAVTDKTLSPSESRELNQPCLLQDIFGEDTFYDYHDAWHFLSACGLFLSFLFLLTLDDGIRNKPTDDIPVF